MDQSAEILSPPDPNTQQHTQSGVLFTALVIEVFRLSGALVMAGNQLCQDTELTSTRWQVLGAIALAHHPLTVSQIGRSMGLTRQTVQRIVDDLETLRLVQRLEHPEHRRARLVQLTALGEASYAQISQRQVPWANHLSEGLKLSELETTLRVLRALDARLEDQLRSGDI